MDIELPEVRAMVCGRTFENLIKIHYFVVAMMERQFTRGRMKKKMKRQQKRETKGATYTTNDDDADEQSTKSKHKLHAAGNRIL